MQLGWSFVQEPLGPGWLAQDLDEFLETQLNHIGTMIRLFWLVFATIF
jgi:hypothetical protein